MSQTLMRASRQWSTRPADERFLNLDLMLADQQAKRERSTQKVISSRKLEAVALEPDEGESLATAGLVVRDNESGEMFAPTHWSFGQLAGIAKAPSGYLQTLPSEIVKQNLNWGLRFNRDITDVGTLTRSIERSDVETTDGPATAAQEYAQLMAATGASYGRVWNMEIIENVRRVFGNGVDGVFRIPGEFGKKVPITKQNTTLYAGDRDCFIFLADEDNKIEVPNMRAGATEPRQLSRGFFVWNSEVGSTSLGVAMFLFDFACLNRMVWGTLDYQEIRVRHTASAPDKFVDEIAPALLAMHDRPSGPIIEAVKKAQAAKIDGDVEQWLKDNRKTSARLAAALSAVHEEEEGRPMESLYDVSNALTAYAKGINFANDRVALEREAGRVFELAQ